MATSDPSPRPRSLFPTFSPSRRSPTTTTAHSSWRYRLRTAFFRRQRDRERRRNTHASLLLPPPSPFSPQPGPSSSSSSSSFSPALSSSSSYTSPAPLPDSSTSQTTLNTAGPASSSSPLPLPPQPRASSWLSFLGGLFSRPGRRRHSSRSRRYRSSNFLLFPRHIADVRRVLDLLFYEQSFFVGLTSFLGASHLGLLIYTCIFEKPLEDSPSFLPVLCVMLALSILTLACRVHFLIHIKSLQAAWWYRPVTKDTVTLLSSPLSQMRRLLFIISFCVYFATLHLVYYQGGSSGGHSATSAPGGPTGPSADSDPASSSSSRISEALMVSSSSSPSSSSDSSFHSHPDDFPSISSSPSPEEVSIHPNGEKDSSPPHLLQTDPDLGVGGGDSSSSGGSHAPILLRYISVLVLAFLSLLGPHILLLACTCTTFFLFLCGSSERCEQLLAEDRCSHGRALPRRLLHRLKEEKWSSASCKRNVKSHTSTRVSQKNLSSSSSSSPSSPTTPSLTQVLIPSPSRAEEDRDSVNKNRRNNDGDGGEEEGRMSTGPTQRRSRRTRGGRRIRQGDSSSSSSSLSNTGATGDPSSSFPRQNTLRSEASSTSQGDGNDSSRRRGQRREGREREERGRKRRWMIRRERNFHFFKWKRYQQKRRKNDDAQEGEEALDGSDDTQVCAICLCPFQENDVIRRLPCDHFFHSACISRWLKSRASCPLRCHINFFTGTRIQPPPDPSPTNSSSSSSSSSSSPQGPIRSSPHPSPPPPSPPPPPCSSSSSAEASENSQGAHYQHRLVPLQSPGPQPPPPPLSLSPSFSSLSPSSSCDLSSSSSSSTHLPQSLSAAVVASS
ncbi:zinc c3hc4 type (ring finger) domain-containing protein [Cystoisospora suis]|uniref:Zinc c3hc4 type (Ring finger) domain-containing protein n=1 Tax=Cystoisospora suis TaxID=483139 RepID=A0A2C6L910_9APIC|nr:zinc c3hc4 type (ring finger) domain-containing protein [Cystoisospora suis]